MNEEIHIVGFTVSCHFVEDQFRIFYEPRHTCDRTIERGEEVVPVHRDHKFRACLFHCLRKENLFRFGIRLCDTRDAEEQDIRLNTVQLPFDVIETGADQDFLISGSPCSMKKS